MFGREEDTIVRRAVRPMMTNVEFRLSLLEICECLRISRRRFERLFLRETGRSPAATYLDIRLQVARDQLFYSNNPVAHIAEVTGFQSDAHFCRAFRKRFGDSPSRVRQNFRCDQRSKFYPIGTSLTERDLTRTAGDAR